MSGDWERTVDQAFVQVLDLPPDEREPRLLEIEAEDPDLAHEVRRLLRFTEDSGDDFEARLISLPSEHIGRVSAVLDEGDLKPGTRIGRYRIGRVIGRGGWGTLYLAEREGDFKKEVALKVLRRGVDTDEVLKRFEAERQILASLEHPYIARLLDGGSTEDGRPWLVLTYVDGVPITDYCQGRSQDEILELFLQLCDAVQYAHRRLIIHRDLKPGNVLVDREGKIRLLDFGIAKLLSGNTEDQHLTGTGVRLFTPEYATPEQLLGKPATTATDVYQLSHLLYRLLNGRSPYDAGRDATIVQLQRAICDDPPRPVEPRLKGDLEAILLKGLRKEPEERYAGAESLAADIRAYLEDRPVSAHADGPLYRLRKVVRRNPWQTAALVVVLLGALLYTTTVNRYAAELARERDRAQAQTRTAEEVTDFLTGLFALPGEPMGDTTTVRTVLERGVERAETELPGDPVLQAGILSVMAQSYLALGTAADAIPLAERALEVDGGFEDDPQGRVRAMERLAAALSQAGRVDEADAVGEEALDLIRDVEGERSILYTSILNILALNHQRAGRGTEAEEGFRRAIELRESLVAEGEPESILTTPYSNLGNLLQTMNRPHEAIEALERAIELMDGSPEYDRGRGVTYNVLGMAQQRAGDREAAEASFRTSIELHRRNLGDRHPTLANTLQNLSVLLRNLGEYDEAEALVRESLAIREAVYGDGGQVELSLNTLGNLYRDTGRTEEAIQVLSDLLERRIARTGPNSTQVAVARNNLARALQNRGDWTEAEAHYLAGIEIFEEAGLTGTPGYLTFRTNLGRLYLESGDLDRAREILEETLAAREEVLGPDHPDTEVTRALLTRSTAP